MPKLINCPLCNYELYYDKLNNNNFMFHCYHFTNENFLHVSYSQNETINYYKIRHENLLIHSCFIEPGFTTVRIGGKIIINNKNYTNINLTKENINNLINKYSKLRSFI